MKKTFFLFLYVCGLISSVEGIPLHNLPERFMKAVGSIEYDSLGGKEAVCEVQRLDAHTLHVALRFDLDRETPQDDWSVCLEPAIAAKFTWANHLTPEEGNVIDRHCFRTPAIIWQDEKTTLILIPDVDLIPEDPDLHWYMDLDVPHNRVSLGISRTEVEGHVLFRKVSGAIHAPGTMRFGFYLKVYDDETTLRNPFRPVLSFFWKRWGHRAFEEIPFNADRFTRYCEYAYGWAFDRWGDSVWQEFEIAGRRVGAPVFIVNVTQSPGYPGIVNEREFRSIWNQAWFSSLRSASGLYRYARRCNDDALLEKARMTKELALSFPRREGFFYGLVGTPMERIEAGGRSVNRSKGWNDLFWGNSNRNPFTWDAEEAPFHILDMSWTALQMLTWYADLERDERLLDYAVEYAEALMKIQTDAGFFPAWIDTQTLQPYEILTVSPETSLSAWFLLRLADLTGEGRYERSALRAVQAVIGQIVPEGRWEDFETYWSCCRLGTDKWVGKKIERNGMYKQCNLSMFWTAGALLAAYERTHERHYLEWGQRTLDELMMTQASWQPPYIYVDAVGGFGVMNADAEWNDARQSLFAPLILDYARCMRSSEYRERGLAALNASFQMMYCPENPRAKIQWEKAWPFFGPCDYGFTMENYGHGGVTGPQGEGMGEFTIYDWGNGAAAEAFQSLYDRYGKKLFDKEKR